MKKLSFILLLIVFSFFSGFIIGKICENHRYDQELIKAGIKPIIKLSYQQNK